MSSFDFWINASKLHKILNIRKLQVSYINGSAAVTELTVFLILYKDSGTLVLFW